MGAAPRACADDKVNPSRAYLEFKAAAEKAETLSEVLPYLSTEYREMLESRPKEDSAKWLARIKDSANKSDVTIGKETITENKAVLEAVGKDSEGTPLNGKIYLVKEATGWKLDEQGWSSSGTLR
jgi:hypothetical protein